MGDDAEKWEVNQLLFADDSVLEVERKMVLKEFSRVCRCRKLKVNAAKSKDM